MYRAIAPTKDREWGACSIYWYGVCGPRYADFDILMELFFFLRIFTKRLKKKNSISGNHIVLATVFHNYTACT